MDKPQHQSGYTTEKTAAIRSLCLLIATRLNDLMPQVRIVGGLVPSLIIQTTSNSANEPHVGTLDLDLGLAISVLDQEQYQEISRRLRQAGFKNDENRAGNPTRQRWKDERGLTVDFLIPPTDESIEANRIQQLESDFAALVTPGLDLAFQDTIEIEIDDRLPSGDKASRTAYVCGPGAFVVLKALALCNRGEPKDAYDLHYVLANWEQGIEDIVERILVFQDLRIVDTAIAYLEEDFATIDHVGPGKVDEFLGGVNSHNDDLRADVSAAVLNFCRRVRAGRSWAK